MSDSASANMAIRGFLTSIGEDITQPNCNIDVFALYEYAGRIESFTTSALFLWNNDPKIELTATKKLDANRFHTGFDGNYQEFCFAVDGEISIEGNSPKMGGKYRITLRPIS